MGFFCFDYTRKEPTQNNSRMLEYKTKEDVTLPTCVDQKIAKGHFDFRVKLRPPSAYLSIRRGEGFTLVLFDAECQAGKL